MEVIQYRCVNRVNYKIVIHSLCLYILWIFNELEIFVDNDAILCICIGYLSGCGLVKDIM